MQVAPLPSDESDRLSALARYKVLNTPPELPFDDIALLASQICGTPIALVSLLDPHRQWFKAKVGLSVTETPRDIAFCSHAILQPHLMVVPDALEDQRFSDNPLVTADPHIRFYAGTPLQTSDGHALGTLCVIDRVPRELSPGQREALKALGRQVIAQLELRLQLEDRDRLLKKLEEAHQMLARLVVRDPLTDLYNRRYLLESLTRELQRADRSRTPVGLILVDLDHFKSINDTYGHLAGDEVLRQVARFLERHVRGGDIVCRYGGEEFVVILPGGSLADTQRRADGIRHQVKALRMTYRESQIGPLTVSLGVAVFPDHGRSEDTLLAAADRALYRAKIEGRDRAVLAERPPDSCPA